MKTMNRSVIYQRFVSEFHSGGPPTPAGAPELDEAERVLSTTFPVSYRQFMESHGAVHTPGIFDLVSPLSEVPSLHNLASIAEVVSEAAGLWSAGTPRDLVVIGDDCMGNLFCLPRLQQCAERPDDLPVRFFDHEFLDVAVVARSFDDWLQGYLDTREKSRKRVGTEAEDCAAQP